MRKRGRPSAASLAVTAPTIGAAPPLPPDGLSVAELDVWAATVLRLPAGYIPPDAGEQFAAYCRHAVGARNLSRLVDQFEAEWLRTDDGLARFDRLLRMRERETRAVLACARTLRLTPQSRIDASGAARRASGPSRSAYDILDLEGDHDGRQH